MNFITGHFITGRRYADWNFEEELNKGTTGSDKLYKTRSCTIKKIIYKLK